MIEQLKTIREFFLLPVPHSPQDTLEYGRAKVRAEIAVSQIEAAVGEQEPVAWIRGSGIEMLKLENGGCATVYASEGMSNHSSPLYATPVAQPPQYEAADMASAAAQGFRDGVASVDKQQEPVAWAWKHIKTGDVGCYFEDPATVGIKVDHPSYEWTKLYAAPVAQQPPHDHVAVTWDAARTRILAVTLQDAEGRVLCVIDEAPAQQPQAEPDDEIIKERDDAEDFIDMLLDEVLGTDRPEWTSAYGRDDALRDVQERMTALHKPTVDKAWERFDKAQQPQAEAVPPGYVLVPVEPTAGMCKAAADAWLDCGSRLVLNKAGAAVRAAIAQQKGGV